MGGVGRARRGDGRRRAAGARACRAVPGPARRLRPLRRDLGRPERHHLRGRGDERVGRRVASCRTACSTTTTPARCRRRASRRTCGCSGCSATSTHAVPSTRQRVVVIGCGAGVTAGAVSIDPRLQHETIAEIEPLVPRVVSTSTSATYNFNVVDNPKVHVHIDDARHFMLTTRREVRRAHVGPARSVGQGRGDALHAGVLRGRQGAPEPGRRGDAVRAALREQRGGGEERDRDVLRGVSRTACVFGNTHNGQGYDLVLVGQKEPDPDRRRCDRGASSTSPEYAAGGAVAAARSASTRRSSCSRPTPASRPTWRGWLKDALINRDRNLRLQYLAGMGLNLYQSGPIYQDMVSYAAASRTICSPGRPRRWRPCGTPSPPAGAY